MSVAVVVLPVAVIVLTALVAAVRAPARSRRRTVWILLALGACISGMELHPWS